MVKAENLVSLVSKEDLVRILKLIAGQNDPSVAGYSTVLTEINLDLKQALSSEMITSFFENMEAEERAENKKIQTIINNVNEGYSDIARTFTVNKGQDKKYERAKARYIHHQVHGSSAYCKFITDHKYIDNCPIVSSKKEKPLRHRRLLEIGIGIPSLGDATKLKESDEEEYFKSCYEDVLKALKDEKFTLKEIPQKGRYADRLANVLKQLDAEILIRCNLSRSAEHDVARRYLGKFAERVFAYQRNLLETHKLTELWEKMFEYASLEESLKIVETVTEKSVSENVNGAEKDKKKNPLSLSFGSALDVVSNITTTGKGSRPATPVPVISTTTRTVVTNGDDITAQKQQLLAEIRKIMGGLSIPALNVLKANQLLEVFGGFYDVKDGRRKVLQDEEPVPHVQMVKVGEGVEYSAPYKKQEGDTSKKQEDTVEGSNSYRLRRALATPRDERSRSNTPPAPALFSTPRAISRTEPIESIVINSPFSPRIFEQREDVKVGEVTYRDVYAYPVNFLWENSSFDNIVTYVMAYFRSLQKFINQLQLLEVVFKAVVNPTRGRSATLGDSPEFFKIEKKMPDPDKVEKKAHELQLNLGQLNLTQHQKKALTAISSALELINELLRRVREAMRKIEPDTLEHNAEHAPKSRPKVETTEPAVLKPSAELAPISSKPKVETTPKTLKDSGTFVFNGKTSK